MTDRPTSRPTDPRTERRGVVNSDVPSETLATGLPEIGSGASAAHFARDSVDLQAEDGESANETAKDADEVRGID